MRRAWVIGLTVVLFLPNMEIGRNCPEGFGPVKGKILYDVGKQDLSARCCGIPNPISGKESGTKHLVHAGHPSERKGAERSQAQIISFTPATPSEMICA